jgi:carbonic anhydrase
MIDRLLENNRQWAARTERENPGFFGRLAGQQSPEYLWIGCSDSRVPANQIVGLLPGEVFVHRNVANVVSHSDLNVLSVMQFAIEVLKVRHVIVCGHYGCGGVAYSLDDRPHGLIDNWLRHVQDVARAHRDALASQPDAAQRLAALCVLNVIEQVRSVARTTVVQDAWRREHPLHVHGLIYDIHNGLIENLGVSLGPGDREGYDARIDAAVPRALAARLPHRPEAVPETTIVERRRTPR